MRILHFSDVHLREPWRTAPWTDYLGKRLVGGLNLALGRWKCFADAHAKVAALDGFRREQDVDLVICTGDYTALGTEAELREAAKATAPLREAPLGFASVPGNHDIYVWDVLRQRRFVRNFGETLDTDLPEYRVDGSPWPLVRLVGDDVAVVAVDSARPNPLPWLSTGRIPEPQLEALARVLADDEIRRRFTFVMTHYAPRLADGQDDTWNHRLVNADRLLEVCRDVEPGALLCGHVHRRYRVEIEGVRPPLFCAGSTTKDGVEGLWVYEIERERRRAIPGTWRDGGYVLEPELEVAL